MKIIIGKAARPEHINTYVLSVTYMMGDADAYETEVLCTHNQALAAAEFLSARPGRLEGDWKSLPNAWIVEDASAWTEHVTVRRNPFLFWPVDATGDTQVPARMHSWKLTWYDETGTAHPCTIATP